MTAPTVPGRITDRSRKRCPTCDARFQFGEPKGTDSWPRRLSLSQEQVNLLLTAAAEFMELHHEYVRRSLKEGEPPPDMPSAVEFMDWVAPDALYDGYRIHRDYDGIRRHVDAPGSADPLPYAPLPKIRGAA